jgi:hypothetical protein
MPPLRPTVARAHFRSFAQQPPRRERASPDALGPWTEASARGRVLIALLGGQNERWTGIARAHPWAAPVRLSNVPLRETARRRLASMRHDTIESLGGCCPVARPVGRG